MMDEISNNRGKLDDLLLSPAKVTKKYKCTYAGVNKPELLFSRKKSLNAIK
jgi:hypothetical protein